MNLVFMYSTFILLRQTLFVIAAPIYLSFPPIFPILPCGTSVIALTHMRPVHLRGLPAQNPQTRRFDNRTGVNLSYNKASVLGPRPVLPGNAIRSREKGDLIYDGPFHLLKEIKPGIVQQVQQVEESDGTGSKGCVTLLSFTPSHGKPRSDFGLVQTTYRHIAIDKNENYARGKSRQRGNSHTKKVLIGPRFPIQ